MAEKNPNNRHEILLEAVTRCLNEMYQKSQPSATWEQVNENVRNDVYGGAKDAYNFYYLADQEYLDILDKYMSMYNIKNRWSDNAQLMIDYLNRYFHSHNYPLYIHNLILNSYSNITVRYYQVPALTLHQCNQISPSFFYLNHY